MTTIWHVQAAEMALMNWQVHQQRLDVANQATLHQVLHETEQTARRVTNTEAVDTFAATVLGRAWLRQVQSVNAGGFHDFQAKRAWQAAVETIQNTVSRCAPDRGTQQKVDSYLTRMDRLTGFQRHMGTTDPARYLQMIEQHHPTDRKGLAMVAAAIACFFIIGAAGSKSPASILVFVFMVCLPWGVIRLVMSALRRMKAMKAANAFVHQYVWFQQEPDGGVWLQQVWGEHPYLFNEAPHVERTEGPRSSADPSGRVVERQVVERQIVVVRCKFCKTLTPVDRATCEHCGAAGFGSAQA